MKLCIVYNNLLPYHYARLIALGKVVSNLLVIEVSDRSAIYYGGLQDTVKGLNKEILFAGEMLETIPALAVKEATKEALDRYKPDIVVTAGYHDTAAQAAAKWAKANSSKAVLMMESWKGDKKRWWIKEKAKAWMIKRWYDRAFVGGWRHHLYALSLGFHPRHIWRGLDVVDNNHFKANAAKYRTNEAELRRKYKLPLRYFLCVSRHSPEKNLKGLLRAYKLYREYYKEWGLVLVGDGPQRNELERYAHDQQLCSVVFTGWVQYEKLPMYYAMATAFILPSISEPWGLVVNEAMASGLPVLVSDKCGALPEMCWRGINGYDFDPHNVNEIVKVLSAISSNVERCAFMGRVSEEIVTSFTPKRWARILLACIENTDTYGY